jgi:hypothetical protein
MDNIFSSMGNLSFDPSLLTTLTPEISSKLQNILDKFSTNPILSALSNLSGVPMHPYDQLKLEVYGPDFKNIKFKTLEDVPAPESFKPEEVVQAVTNKIQGMQRTLLENADRPPHLFTNTMLNSVSGEKIIPDTDKYKKHIEFVELLRNIQVSKLPDEQVYDYAKKIIAEFVKTY